MSRTTFVATIIENGCFPLHVRGAYEKAKGSCLVHVILELIQNDSIGLMNQAFNIENDDDEFVNLNFTEYANLCILLCKEIGIAYIYGDKVPHFDVPHVLQKLIFDEFNVKYFDADEFVCDCKRVSAQIIRPNWVILRQLFPALVASHICDDMMYEWTKFVPEEKPGQNYSAFFKKNCKKFKKLKRNKYGGSRYLSYIDDDRVWYELIES
jgi:hypothetical protein